MDKFRIELMGSWLGHKSFFLIGSEGFCGQLTMTSQDFQDFTDALMLGKRGIEIVWTNGESYSLPHPPATGDRPKGQRVDERTVDERSEKGAE